MKKTLLLVGSLFGLLTFSFSQITVTSSNFAAAGDMTITSTDTLISTAIGSTGTNQTWSFTSMTSHFYDTMNFLATSATPYATDFPSSNITMDLGNDDLLFINSSSTTLEILGGLVFGQPLTFSDPQTRVNFPLNYGDNLSDTYAAIAEVSGADVGLPVDSVRLTLTGTSSSSVDSWGTMTTPLGTYDVLRVTDTNIQNTITDMKVITWSNASNETDTTYSHTYYTNHADVKFVLLEYEFDPATNMTNSIDWLHLVSPAGIEENKINFDIYPNPAQDNLIIRTDENIDLITIIDLSGKVMMTSFKSTINVSSIPKGFYFANIKSGNKTATKKFAKF